MSGAAEAELHTHTLETSPETQTLELSWGRLQASIFPKAVKPASCINFLGQAPPALRFCGVGSLNPFSSLASAPASWRYHSQI